MWSSASASTSVTCDPGVRPGARLRRVSQDAGPEEIEEVTGVLEPEGAALPAIAPASALDRPVASPAVQAAAVAASGLMAGMATVVAVRRARSRGLPSLRGSRRSRKSQVLASRSFLVDVHLLDRR